MIKRQLKKIVYRRNSKKYLSALDFGLRDNQFYLISYPKSGNTWVRIILANLLNETGEEIALHNVGKIIPDSNSSSQVSAAFEPGSIFKRLPIQVLKSHDPYLSYYKDKKVILIVRDGRDAVNSYLHYQRARLTGEITRENIIKGQFTLPIGTWSEYAVDWHKGKCKNKLVIKYEDLIRDPISEVERICQFVGLATKREILEKAIEASSFNKLKTLEEKYGHFDDRRKDKGEESAFVRKGAVGGAVNEFSEGEMRLFWKYCTKGMELLGYK